MFQSYIISGGRIRRRRTGIVRQERACHLKAHAKRRSPPSRRRPMYAGGATSAGPGPLNCAYGSGRRGGGCAKNSSRLGWNLPQGFERFQAEPGAAGAFDAANRPLGFFDLRLSHRKYTQLNLRIATSSAKTVTYKLWRTASGGVAVCPQQFASLAEKTGKKHCHGRSQIRDRVVSRRSMETKHGNGGHQENFSPRRGPPSMPKRS